MMRTFCMIMLFLPGSASITYAHQDFWKMETYGNVKVRIKTGFLYEEINKVWIIGQLANELARNLKYTDTIFLDFDHRYTGDCLPDYFISFDDGTIKEKWPGGIGTRMILKNNAIVIREVSRKFHATATLKLLEYAILNLSSIKSTQINLDYNKNYCEWIVKSIDTSLTRKIVLKNTSTVINEVLKTRVYRSIADMREKNNVSYYFQHNKYHFYSSSNKIKDSVLLSVDNVYQFKTISSNQAIVLDTDSTFYFIQENHPQVSKRWTIKNKYDYYEPYEISKAGFNKVKLSYWYYSHVKGIELIKKTIVYQSDKGMLTQD